MPLSTAYAAVVRDFSQPADLCVYLGCAAAVGKCQTLLNIKKPSDGLVGTQRDFLIAAKSVAVSQ